jgi:hypothetical protein
MPFLRGSLSFERFTTSDFEAQLFTEEHLELLANHAAGQVQTDSPENIHVGFLGGDHLFDQAFEFGKNVINNTLHAGLRVDSNQIPAAIRNAWLQMELAALLKDSPTGRLNKAQKTEAKEAVEERCRSEAATGKYRKMASFPWLWDLQHSTLYFSGSQGVAGHWGDLLERVFDIEVRRLSAGSIAQNWAIAADRFAELDDLLPTSFVAEQSVSQFPWTNEHSQAPDFLGNEFLLWLWWRLEHESDTFTLADESEVTAMLTKTLMLECPLGESGKETISAESPVKLPEALQAVQTGKLPRKTGMTLVRDGMQFELVLQAETFAISGAKIVTTDEEPMENEERIEAIRFLSETVDGIFHLFCDRRTSAAWESDREQMRRWLANDLVAGQRAA